MVDFVAVAAHDDGSTDFILLASSSVSSGVSASVICLALCVFVGLEVPFFQLFSFLQASDTCPVALQNL